MNILFVFDMPIVPSNGGVERLTHTLTINLIKEGYNVSFLSRNYRPDSQIQNIVAKQYYFPTKDIYDTNNVEFYHKLISELQIDIVINQNGAEESSYLFCEVPMGVKLITVNHTYPMLNYYTMSQSMKNLVYDYTAKNITRYVIKGLLHPLRCLIGKRKVKNKLNRLYTYILQKSDKMVVLSPAYFKDIEFATSGKCDYSKLVAIPNVNSFSDETDIQYKKKQILYVGRFTIKEKRPDRVLHIWKRLYKQYPDWEFIIIGGQSELYQKYMSRFIQRKKLERISIKTGVDVKPYYRQAALSCLVSNYEGFGLVLTEAMQCGTVPVAFNSYGAAADIINDAHNGYLISPFDYDKFADKLSLLMSDEDLRSRMSKNAVNSVKRFNFENIYPQWKKLLN